MDNEKVDLKIETEPAEKPEKDKPFQPLLPIIGGKPGTWMGHTMESEPKLEDLSNKILTILCSETEIDSDLPIGLPGINKGLAYLKPQGVSIDEKLLASMETFKRVEFDAVNLAEITDQQPLFTVMTYLYQVYDFSKC